MEANQDTSKEPMVGGVADGGSITPPSSDPIPFGGNSANRELMRRPWGAILYVVVCSAAILGFIFGVPCLREYYDIVSRAVIGTIATVILVIAPAVVLAVNKPDDRVWLYAALALALLFIGIFVGLCCLARPGFNLGFVSGNDPSLEPLEVTDYLIDHPDERDLRQGMVSARFEFRIEPAYSGTKKLGQLAAVVSGDGKKAPIEKSLWNQFDSDSQPMTFTLTLQELVDLSGIQMDVISRTNVLDKGFIPYNQARLEIRIVQSNHQNRAYSSFEVPVLNAPWDQRSVLVDRGGRKFVDVAIENRGEPGKFAVVFHVTQVTTPIPSDDVTVWSGNKHIDWWITPPEYQTIASGGFITLSVPLTESLNPPMLNAGRYLVEAMAIKQQPYIAFTYPLTTTWQTPFLFNRWWFSRAIATDLHVFNVPAPITDDLVRKEIDRLRQEQDVDLGAPLRAAETITSSTGTVGYRQVFDNGEILVHDNTAYSLYGSILDHYHTWVKPDGVIARYVGFPMSQAQTVTSSLGTTATLMEFQDMDYPNAPAAIYTSSKGVAGIRAGFRSKHLAEGGHAGRLGFPVADEEYYPDCLIQRFENGYLVYPEPRSADGSVDSKQPILTFPAGRGRGSSDDCPPGDAIIAREWIRLYERGEDLGATIAPTETITSSSGIVGYRQVFDNGEIVVHSGQAYSIYGEVYRHYKQMVESEERWVFSGKPLLPVTQLQVVDGVDGGVGQMIEFEGPSENFPRIVFYASPRGVAAVFGEILDKYEAEGGPTGWLGFPLSDLRYYPHSEIQAFRHGYIVSYYPAGPGTDYDYSRPAIAISYRGSQPTLVEVMARQSWQDTGVWLRAGDQITIEQLGDLWTHSPAIPPYDASGTPVTSTVAALPLSSAAVGSLIGQVGAGSVFPVGRLAASTAESEGHLLLRMNDADYQDNEGFIAVEIYAPPHSVPLDTLKFDYKDSPLVAGHGWRLVGAHEGAVTFTPVEDEYVGRAVRIRATESYGMDHTASEAANQRADTIEVVAASEKDVVVYANIELQQCDVKSAWLKFHEGGRADEEPQKVSDEEWSIAAQPAAEIGGAWRRYQIDLIDAVHRSFGQEGCSFGKLLGYRLRGDMDIQQIAAYDRQP
jgi:hypothetical protein